MSRVSTIIPDGARVHAEYLSSAWAARQRSSDFIINENELHCLREIALHHDDETVSHLLLRKLRLAKTPHESLVPLDVAVLNSIVDFSFGRQRSTRALVHPSAAPGEGRLSVGSLLGAGVIGLRVGQHILWPDKEGSLHDLVLHSVERRRRAPCEEEARRLKPGQ